MTALSPSTAPAPPPSPSPRRLPRPHRPALRVRLGLVVALAARLVWLWGPLADAAVTARRHHDGCAAARCPHDQRPGVLHKKVYCSTTIAPNALPFLASALTVAAFVLLRHSTATPRTRTPATSRPTPTAVQEAAV
ncbi:hypothetical protein ACIBVL_38760 [Streptomyces sp. NPDC049687]|uniref:hypothetical protein n=1 Tax=Streptomyces sp. NPDC049687 TaxID=3365596 RepID=UPI0037AB7A70